VYSVVYVPQALLTQVRPVDELDLFAPSDKASIPLNDRIEVLRHAELTIVVVMRSCQSLNVLGVVDNALDRGFRQFFDLAKTHIFFLMTRPFNRRLFVANGRKCYPAFEYAGCASSRLNPIPALRQNCAAAEVGKDALQKQESHLRCARELPPCGPSCTTSLIKLKVRMAAFSGRLRSACVLAIALVSRSSPRLVAMNKTLRAASVSINTFPYD
jgi:hypothetical protein